MARTGRLTADEAAASFVLSVFAGARGITGSPRGLEDPAASDSAARWLGRARTRDQRRAVHGSYCAPISSPSIMRFDNLVTVHRSIAVGEPWPRGPLSVSGSTSIPTNLIRGNSRAAAYLAAGRVAEGDPLSNRFWPCGSECWVRDPETLLLAENLARSITRRGPDRRRDPLLRAEHGGSRADTVSDPSQHPELKGQPRRRLPGWWAGATRRSISSIRLLAGRNECGPRSPRYPGHGRNCQGPYQDGGGGTPRRSAA